MEINRRLNKEFQEQDNLIQRKFFRHARYIGGGGSPPPPPTPPTPKEQSSANIETAIAQGYMNNLSKTSSPFGTTYTNPSGYVNVGGNLVPRFEQRVVLSGPMQRANNSYQNATAKIFGLGEDQVGRVRDALSVGYDYNSIPEIPGSGELDADRQLFSDALYNRHTSRLDPRFAQEKSDLEARLRNQGLTSASNPEAWSREWENFNRSKNDAYENAANTSIIGSGDEMARAFGLGQTRRNQAIYELDQLRNKPLNEFNALMSSGQVQTPQAPNFVGGGSVGAPNLSSMYQNQLDAYNYNVQNQNNRNSTFGGIADLAFGLGKTVVPFFL